VSDYETIQRRRNIIVGVFVVGAMCALAGLIYKFGDLPWFVTKHRSFQVFVQFQTAPGVQRDTPVRFCGYQIGRVTKVMAPEVRRDLNTAQQYHQTVVVLSIKKRYVDIPSNVSAKLMTRGLGSSYIELTVDPARLSQKKLDELVDGLKSLISNTNGIVGDPNNRENLKETLANLAEASKQATKTIEEFRQFAASGTDTFTAILGTSEELSKATAQLRLILEKVNSGDGSAGMLINDGRFYENLLENTQQIQILLEELTSFIAQARVKGLPMKLK